MKKSIFLALPILVISVVSCTPKPMDPSADDIDVADKVISVFENSTPVPQYDYIKALGDGRGYTAGRAGFTSATGDLLEVVETYEREGSGAADRSAWSRLLPRLRELAADESGDIQGLEDLPALWQASSLRQKFRRAQDKVVDQLYRGPAREWCRRLGLKTHLGYLVIYDSIIQHGNGSDDDGLPALIRRTGGFTTESEFLLEFLKVRRADLLNPANTDTTDEWRGSVDRVDALRRLIESGNWALSSPVHLQVWDSSYDL